MLWARAREALRRSLTYRLISSYLVILGTGGLVTSLVGSWIVSATMLDLGKRTVIHDLTTARAVYEGRLSDLRRTVQLVASSAQLWRRDTWFDTAAAPLSAIRNAAQFDFLTLTDAQGRVLLRVRQPDSLGDDVTGIRVVRAALQGEVASGTELLTPEQLAREDTALLERARMRIVETPMAAASTDTVVTAGMALVAAAPVRSASGALTGVLYGGRLLNRSAEIVDQVWDVTYQAKQYQARNVGAVTIFQGDVRIATNVRNGQDQRALGTRASADVAAAVFGRGATWDARAFVVNDWYMSAYEPIRNYDGAVIGMLYVGLREKLFTATRDRVILSFFVIAGLGFVAIIITTYVMTRSVTRPLVEMAAATRRISAGEFDTQVRSDAPAEIGVLAESFNNMLRSLRLMKADLEDWGRTLERRVQERSDELVAMQARVAESERLASLGMLAAGVAHEINNPMGGILALTHLTLEDMPPAHEHRANLEEVVRQTERCRDIVRGLLEFSRQSQTGTELVDLNDVVRSTLALISNQALFFNIEMVTRLEPELPRLVGHRSQLEQVCMNLIVNAAQAVAESGTITVETSSCPELESVQLAVADTGCGIAPDKLGHVFDPFFTTKQDRRGIGLGLSIVYGIVTKHGGSITVNSEPGAGTAFTLRFPAAVGNLEGMDAEAGTGAGAG